MLCQLGPVVLAVMRLQRRQRAPVQPDAAGGRQPFVERVPDEYVSEAQAPGLARHVGDDACGHRLVEHVQEVVDRDAAHAGEGVEREVAAQDRREHEHPVALGREVGEPAGDRVAHGRGDGEPDISASPPSTASSRTISPTKSGLPSVSACRAAMSCGDAISAAVSTT